jgi:hypothetical protein
MRRFSTTFSIFLLLLSAMPHGLVGYLNGMKGLEFKLKKQMTKT